MCRGFTLGDRGAPDAQNDCSPPRCTARLGWPDRSRCLKCGTRGSAPIPASVDRRGCSTTTSGPDGSARRIAAADRIRWKRVESVATRATILQAAALGRQQAHSSDRAVAPSPHFAPVYGLGGNGRALGPGMPQSFPTLCLWSRSSAGAAAPLMTTAATLVLDGGTA